MCTPQSNGSQCDCQNCREIENIAECDICVEPFWDNGISSCYTCGSLLCWTCAQKLITCPFCRVSIVCPWQRNLAVEKLIKKLKLPCRYSRRGCTQCMLYKNRKEHERTCKFSPMVCPLSPTCNWQGDMEEISCHLKQAHSLGLLNGDKVTVEISSLRKKVQETEEHLSKYVVMLQCHSSFFFCKIVLFKRKLKIVFIEVSSKKTNRKYVAWLELLNSKPVVKSILEISNNPKCNNELDISCDSLFLSKTCSMENDLKILITIRPLTER